MSKLYIVATPIGNLADVSFRAVQTLKEVDLILCEDTRQTKKLLNHFEISKPTLSYHQHSKLSKVEYILNQLKLGQNLALVSDAGTPTISDPGGKLVAEVVNQLGDQVEIIPLPGACAVITALSVSGLPADKFVFLGFAPLKKKRSKFFKEVVKSKYTVVFYESSHRILKSLEELKKEMGLSVDNYSVVVARELTKKFESLYRGSIDQVLKQVSADEIKGEFVVVIGQKI